MPLTTEKLIELEFSLTLEELKARYTEISQLNTQLYAVNAMAVTVIAGISGLLGWKFSDQGGDQVTSIIMHIGVRMVLLFVSAIFISFMLMKQFIHGRISRQAGYVENVLRPKFAAILIQDQKTVLQYESYINARRLDFLSQRNMLGVLVYDNLIFTIPYLAIMALVIYGAMLSGNWLEIAIYVVFIVGGIWRLKILSSLWQRFKHPTSYTN